MDVGFIGLGQMGTGMAQSLIAAGHTVTAWNRNAAKAEAIGGATVAATPADAAKAGIVVSMLADDHAVEAVTFGANGILTAGEDILHISCSTVSVALTDRLDAEHREAGQRFVSAQVLGRPDAAAAGKLVVFAAGADADIDAARPLFEALGPKLLIMGAEPGMAAAAKLAANFGIAALTELVTEAMAIAGARGVKREAMLGLFNETNFGSRIIGAYGAMIAAQKFEPVGFAMRLGRKDVAFGVAAAPDAELPLARLLLARMDAIIADGGGERDWASLGGPLA
jgi:3-hydroxyisobutyrate dehydrogenase-like beta-hydroxyacid dehydrogenase